MRRRWVAVVLLSTLTILGGVDFLEDIGVIHFSAEMDRSFDDALDNYGEALRSAEYELEAFIQPAPLASGGYNGRDRDLSSPQLHTSARRKQNLDFSQSTFDPLSYSKILLV